MVVRGREIEPRDPEVKFEKVYEKCTRMAGPHSNPDALMPHNGLRMALSAPSDLGPAHFRATKIIFRKTVTDKKLGPTAVRQRGRHHLERKQPGEESPFSAPRP